MRSIILTTLSLALATYTPGQGERSSGDVFLVYERTGGTVYHVGEGVESFSDHLVIFENGRAVLTRGPSTMEFMLDPDTMDRLRTILENADFSVIPTSNPPAQLKSSYSGTSYYADFSEFTIVYKGFRVQAADTGIPVELEPLIRTLIDIVAEHANTPAEISDR